MGIDEEEELLEAEVSSARVNFKNPTSRVNKNMKILDVLSAEAGALVVSKVVELGDDIAMNC